MIEMQIHAQGIMEMWNKLNRLNQAIVRRVDDALNQEITKMHTAAEQLAPKRTGNLASSLFTERTDEWSFKLGARADYASFVEFGTRFTRARGFITQALESTMPPLIQHVDTAIDEAIKEAATS